jgi:hypothetical protein
MATSCSPPVLPTTFTWIEWWVGLIVGGVIITFIFGVVLVAVGTEALDSVRGREPRYLRAFGLALLILPILGLASVFAWALAANTVLKYENSVVTVSRAAGQLTVVRSRAVGGDQVRRYDYGTIEAIEFDYVPGSGGEDSTPSQGVVYLRASGKRRSQIFDGSPCPARALADAIGKTTGLPIRVESGGMDISSFGAFFTQLRCGIQRPAEPTGTTKGPGGTTKAASGPTSPAGHTAPRPGGTTSFLTAVWQGLDVTVLWQWPWASLILVGEVLLVGGAVAIRMRYGSGVGTAPSMLAALGVVVLLALAVGRSGRWPGILGLVALIAFFVARRLSKDEGPSFPGASDD